MGKNHVKYTKLWGCIDSMMNIVVPFVFQHMKREFNYIDAEIEENGIIFPDYRHYYFNLYGVPVIYSSKKEMPEWDWIEDSNYKAISIAQKDGKQGIIRKDGSVFLEPKYKKIKIDFSIPSITVISDKNIQTDIIYRKDIKSWHFLPTGYKYSCFSHDLYVLRRNDNLLFVVDKNFNIVILPGFDKIDVYSQCIVVKKGRKYGIVSRKKTINIDNLKNPIYAPISKIEFDDVKIHSNRAIIIKDSLQGVLNIEDGNILCPPCIPIEYPILPYTLNDNSIAFKTRQRKYGYFDLDGHLLFEINIEDDKIVDSSIRCFQDGKVHILGENYLYVFNKDGSYKKTRLKKQYYCGETYHNYEAERWDALTDGMEGEYPGSGVDYDLLGFD